MMRFVKQRRRIIAFSLDFRFMSREHLRGGNEKRDVKTIHITASQFVRIVNRSFDSINYAIRKGRFSWFNIRSGIIRKLIYISAFLSGRIIIKLINNVENPISVTIEDLELANRFYMHHGDLAGISHDSDCLYLHDDNLFGNSYGKSIDVIELIKLCRIYSSYNVCIAKEIRCLLMNEFREELSIEGLEELQTIKLALFSVCMFDNIISRLIYYFQKYSYSGEILDKIIYEQMNEIVIQEAQNAFKETDLLISLNPSTFQDEQ